MTQFPAPPLSPTEAKPTAFEGALRGETRPRRVSLSRALIYHPEPETRRALEDSLRRLAEGQIAVYEASSPTELLASVNAYDPSLLFVDLDEGRALTLDVVGEVRRPERLVVGLYNPLAGVEARPRSGELDLFRQAVRAGVGDFVPLPASDSELENALGSVAWEGGGRERADGQVVAFLSHKGGVGTTTLAVGTALHLGQEPGLAGDVALCDARIQLGNAVDLFGLTPERDLLDLTRDLDGVAGVRGCLTEPEGTGLQVVASPRDPVAAEEISPHDLSRVLIELKRHFALVVVDTPPALDAMTLAVLDLADSIFVVGEAVAPTVNGTARLLSLLSDLRLEEPRLVINRHSSFEGNLPVETVSRRLERSVDHVVPYDRAVVAGANRGLPLVLSRPKAAFCQAIRGLASECTASLAPQARLGAR